MLFTLLSHCSFTHLLMSLPVAPDCVLRKQPGWNLLQYQISGLGRGGSSSKQNPWVWTHPSCSLVSYLWHFLKHSFRTSCEFRVANTTKASTTIISSQRDTSVLPPLSCFFIIFFAGRASLHLLGRDQRTCCDVYWPTRCSQAACQTTRTRIGQTATDQSGFSPSWTEAGQCSRLSLGFCPASYIFYSNDFLCPGFVNQ